MAITKVSQFLSSPTTTADYEGQNAHINAFIQQMSNSVLHLTEWTTTTVPQIAQGIYLRHAGVLYIVDTSDFTIATGDLSGAGTYYIKLTTSGASLAVAWEDTLTSYAWSIAYQGYYNGTSQLLPYRVVYDAGTSYLKYSIINMKDSVWNYIKYDGSIISTADLQYDSALLPTSASPSTQVVGSTSTYTLPRGVYMFLRSETVGVDIELYDGGTWRLIYETAPTGGVLGSPAIFSDGSTTRINNPSGSSSTVHFRKF